MMSFWLLLLILGAVILFAVLLYLELRWRKAPRAFKAMSGVAIASLAAGTLLGVWSVHLLDAWTSTGTGDAGRTPGSGASVTPTSSPSRAPIPEVTPIVSSTAPAVTPERDRVSRILASYVGQALAQGYAKNTSAGSVAAGRPRLSAGELRIDFCTLPSRDAGGARLGRCARHSF
jgi:hypothetical protein